MPQGESNPVRQTIELLGLGAIAGLMLVGCGGSSSRSQAQAPDEPMVEEAPAGADEASGIPGLSVADVRAMPEAPELPSRFDHTATIEEVEEGAREIAEREERRDQLAGVGVEKRAIFLAHTWWQEVRTLQRGQPSHIPGLTVGEVEDQPSVLELPALFDLRHTPEDLEPHAYITALEEDDAGLLGPELSVEARTTYLTWAWEPLLADRQARYRKALAEREAAADYRIEQAKRRAVFEAEQRALRREIELETERASRETIPVLSPEEEAELAALGGSD